MTSLKVVRCKSWESRVNAKTEHIVERRQTLVHLIIPEASTFSRSWRRLSVALNFKFAPASDSQSLRISNLFIIHSSHLCVRVSQKKTFLFAFRFYFYIRIRNAHDAIAKEFLEFHKKKNKTRNASSAVQRDFCWKLAVDADYTPQDSVWRLAEVWMLEFLRHEALLRVKSSQNVARRQLPISIHKNHSIPSRAYASPHKQPAVRVCTKIVKSRHQIFINLIHFQ